MNRFVGIFLVTIFFVPFLGKSQTQWFEQTLPITTDLYDIEFVNLNIGFAVGANGKILKTTDGGYSWNVVPSGTLSTLYDCQFFNETTGWICGSGGLVLRTSNGGDTWTPNVILAANEFHAVHFFSETTGYVGGKNTITGYAELYYTLNGGSSWTGISPPAGLTNIKDLIFVNLSAGYVMDDWTLNYTTNSGVGWAAISVPTTFQINRVESFDLTNSWLVGNGGTIFYSTTSGTSWIAQTSPTTENLYGISIVDANTIFVCGENGTILRSIDGGNTWSIQTSNVSNTLKSISAVSVNSGWACGIGPKVIHSETDLDLALETYNGPSNVCKNAPFAVTVNVKNIGEYTLDSGTFTVLKGITPVLSYDLITPIPSGQSLLLDLGTISIVNNTVLTINYSGDDLTSNNSLLQPINLIADVDYGTNGPLSACTGEVVQLQAYGGNEYLWLNASADSTAQTQQVTVYENTNYVVKITQTNCIAFDTVAVTIVNGNCGNAAFSPNGDGVNDYFHINNLPVGDNVVTIYNRWGDIIAVFQNYDNMAVSWKGDDSTNNTVVEGTYFYTVAEPNGQAVSKGWVQVVR